MQSSARTQLASLAVRTGDLDGARALLLESMDTSEDADLGTLTVTFALVASAELALAEGDATRAATALGAADGLRRRAGLRGRPSTRQAEAELVTRVTQEVDPKVFKDAFATGSALGQREAVALVRQDGSRSG